MVVVVVVVVSVTATRGGIARVPAMESCACSLECTLLDTGSMLDIIGTLLWDKDRTVS